MNSSTFMYSVRRAMCAFASALLLVPTAIQAQTPAGRPNTSDATRPPAVERPNPQVPPGTTSTPGVTPVPVGTPSINTRVIDTSTTQSAPSRVESQDATSQEATTSDAQTNAPSPILPPMPPLTRLGVNSDNALTLSLNEAIRRALENNNDVELARGDTQFAETTLRAYEGFYDPTLRVLPQFSSDVSPVADTLAGSDQSGTVTVSNINYDYALVKPFRTGGGHYEFFFNNTRQTTSSIFSQFTPFYSSSLGVRFIQPLARNRAIDANRRAIRVQRRLLAQLDADFRRRVIDVVAEVQRAYWDLVFALRDQHNRVTSLNLVRELYRQTERRIAMGTVAPIERTEVQTELASRESEVLVASQNVSIMENKLKRLLLRDPLAPEWSAAIVPTDEPPFDDKPVSLTDALTEARVNRPELSRLNLQKEINDIDLQYFKNQTRKRIDIEATVATTGLAGSPVTPTGSLDNSSSALMAMPTNMQTSFVSATTTATAGDLNALKQLYQTRAAQIMGGSTITRNAEAQEPSTVPESLIGGYGQTLRNLFTLNTRSVVVGVRIELPWRNKRAEAELAGARIRRTQLETSVRAQEQVIEGEVRDAAQAVETARLRVLAARAARRSAEQQLAGEQRLYEVGRSTTFLLFQRENQLTTARSLQLRAETDFNKALADLHRSTSMTLRANNIILEPSPAGQ